ncbi:MAG: pyridoxamine 5'-phosphate oxidase [Vicingaceae bacterium]
MSDIRKEVKNVRRDYNSGELSESEMPKNPYAVFENWMKTALDEKLKEPNAFTISTVVDQQPDSRVVLLRDFSEDGLIFYTNYSSKKAKDLEKNPQVSINFFWAELDRQIRIKARVEKLDPLKSDNYFASRPRESQLGAWASNQSDELESRDRLEKSLKAFEEKFENTDQIPRPDFWGGYLMVPHFFEFWQGRSSRLHDRICYEKSNNEWKMKRLYP